MMIFMTDERASQKRKLQARLDELTYAIGDTAHYSFEQRQEFRKEIPLIESALATFTIFSNLEDEFNTMLPYMYVYRELKPDLVKTISEVTDEVLDIVIQVINNVTKYNELRQIMAASTRKTYDAYLDVGFSSDQAFALTLRSMEAFDKVIASSLATTKPLG